jgi:hypothetical protein
MSISAARETGAKTDTSFSAAATSTNTVSNIGNPDAIVTSQSPKSDNLIGGDAFGAASGAFQVEQNRSIGSSTGQNMKIAAVTDPGGSVASTVKIAASLNSSVTGSFVTNDAVGVAGDNDIEVGTFQAASGAFQVQQNNSENGSTQQNMAVAAVTATGGSVSSLATSTEADLAHTVSGNFPLTGITGRNLIDDGFQGAKGAFQVQQTSNEDSAVGQNMAIVAVDAQNTGTAAAGATGPDAAKTTTTVTNNTAGIFFGTPGFKVTIGTTNEILTSSFQNAKGAFQVQQDGSVNSSVGQNMAITALKENTVPTDLNLLATATD